MKNINRNFKVVKEKSSKKALEILTNLFLFEFIEFTIKSRISSKKDMLT